jgi:hypothetical protein
MKFLSAFLLFSHFIFGISSCTKRISGSGNYINEQRNIGAFSGVESNGSFDVFIVESSTTSLSITGEDNIIKELETVVENGTLKIRFRKSLNVKHGNITITASTPTFKYIALSGSGSIKPQGRWTLNDLQCNLSGSGTIIASLNANQLNVNLSGSGHITLDGESKQSEFILSGSGDIKSFGLGSGVAIASVKGSGDCELKVTKKLNATISGSGRIFYKGNPEEVIQQISGSGRVVKQ